MNAPRDIWTEFAEALERADREDEHPLTPAQIEARREAYEREQIATAQSEDAHAANLKSYAKK